MSMFTARRSNRPAWTGLFLSQADAFEELLSVALLGELLLVSSCLTYWTKRGTWDEIVTELGGERIGITLTQVTPVSKWMI